MNDLFQTLVNRPLPNVIGGVLLFMVLVSGNGQSTAAADGVDSAGVDSIAYQKAVAQRIRSISERVLPSIVSIEVIGVLQSDGEVRQDAPTTGVLVDMDGHVLASSWVARSEAASIIVSTEAGNRFPAKIVGRDEHRELVLLKIDSKGESFQPIEFPNNNSVPAIGSTMLAVARYGESQVPIISSGVLSAIDRLDGTAIQSDVRISPTFYGGPLLDIDGNVAGILIPAVGENGADDPTAWYDSGIAFAVPTEIISAKLDRMKNGETIQSGLLGLVVGGSDPYAPGTTIATVRKRSPADRAGLQAGDELVRVGNRQVRRRQEIKLALGRYDARDEVELEIVRDGQRKVVKATLVDSIDPLRPQSIGVALDGLKVAAVLPRSPADGVLEVGDELKSLDGKTIQDATTLRQQFWAADPDTELQLGIRPISGIDASGEKPGTAPEENVAIIPVPWAGELSSSMIEAIAGLGLPNSSQQSWESTELRLPDVVNEAILWHPSGELGGDTIEGEEDGEADSSLPTSLAIVLLPPSQREPAESLNAWKQKSKALNVAVCLVSSQDEQRWQLSEIEAISKLTASALKQSGADPRGVAVVSEGVLSTIGTDEKSNPADAMALAVSLSTDNVYSGVAIPGSTQPPGIRLRRDAPMRLLRVLMRMEGDAEMPPWTESLTRIGCPTQTTDSVDRGMLLSWCRSLLFL